METSTTVRANDLSSSSPSSPSSPSSHQSSCNSSYGSNSGRRLIDSSNNSVTSLIPGGVVTTRNISTVISPKGNNNSLQFVKIQTPELSKKAVEQIKLAKETKICKEQINEGEEEWQNNLQNWKLKRKQQISQTVEPSSPYDNNNSLNASDICGGRKIKTFAEIIEQRAKSGNRVGFHLQRYLSADDEDEDNNNKSQIQSQDHKESESPPPSETSSNHEQSQPQLQTHRQLQIYSSTPECEPLPEAHRQPEIQTNSKSPNQTQPQPPLTQAPALQQVQSPSRPPKNDSNLRKSTSNSNSIDCGDSPGGRKIKNFVEIIEQRAKSANQAGFHLQRYLSNAEENKDSTKIQTQSQPQAAREPDSPPKPQTSFNQHKSLPQQTPKPRPPPPQLKPSLEPPFKPHSDPPFSPQSEPPYNPQLDQTFTPQSEPQLKPLPDLPKQPELQMYSKPPLLSPAQAPIPQIPAPQHIQSPSGPTKIDSNQRKATREDKDRTVLSVSGKKRCTSCKEELGRGAAAFVVESLSLAYHTNCFRCSVCHVNLSNGFRGVDVRVHFGALHCQNCYSKDGLNYSRV